MYFVRGFQSKIDIPSLGNAIIVNNEYKININFYSTKCKCAIATLLFVVVEQILTRLPTGCQRTRTPLAYGGIKHVGPTIPYV